MLYTILNNIKLTMEPSRGDIAQSPIINMHYSSFQSLHFKSLQKSVPRQAVTRHSPPTPK